MKYLLAFCLTMSLLSPASSQSNDPFRPVVDREAEKFMASKGAVGLAIGIYKKGKTQMYFYGTTDKEKANKPGPNSIFNIASLSKTFAGFLLASAASEQKLNVNDDIRKYIGAGYPNLEYKGEPIRLNHLVSHLSRLPTSLSDRSESPGYSRSDFFKDLHSIKPDTLPGVKFMYSNAAVQLLGYILEDVYHTSLEILLNEKITGPLKMKHTSVLLSGPDMKLKTKGYNEDGAENADLYDRLAGAGGMKSTIEDLLKYVAFQMNETTEAMRLSHQEIWGFDIDANKHYSFSMGWQTIKTKDGLRRIFQDGNLHSYSSVMIFCPELGAGIVVLSNSFMMKQAGDLSNAIIQEVEPGMP
jgi:CubicO group peptidase (beta-lactamase class C family)